MNFEDATTVMLAEEGTRTPLFDQSALEQIVGAGYDADALQVEGPFQPIFDEFQIGITVPRVGTIEGFWNPVGGVERYEARFQFSGIGATAPIRVDALWRGQIVARALPSTGRITEVEIGRPDLATIDEDIIADLGALPTDPADLEQERRTRLIERARSVFAQPDAFSDAVLDRWLEHAGVRSVSDLLINARGTVHGEAIQVTFSPPEAGPAAPVLLPIAAAILVRDAGFSVAELLIDSKLVRTQLLELGLSVRANVSLPRRQALLIIWIVPVTIFDDDDWPGGNAGMSTAQRRAARRLDAGRWLAREGIGLVATG